MKTTTMSVRVPLALHRAIDKIAGDLTADFCRLVTRNEVLNAALEMYAQDCANAQLDVKEYIACAA